MRDYLLFGGLAVTFALVFTTHVLIFAGLLRRKKFGLAVASFFLPPAAPALAIHERMLVRGVLSIVAIVGYAVFWVLSR